MIVGTADFANGQFYTLFTKPKNKGIFIRNHETKKDSYAQTYAGAWGSVQYQAGVDSRTHNTTRWRG